MIRSLHNPKQIRIDSTIKLIDKEGKETSVPVVILVGLNKVEENKIYDIYKITKYLFDKEFVLNKKEKVTIPKKPWWKFGKLK